MRAHLRVWRPALRMARRELWSHRGRSLVLVVLVALPVTAAVIAATLASTFDYSSANSLATQHGSADADLEVEGRTLARVENEDYGVNSFLSGYGRGAEKVDRDRFDADELAGLLPTGSRVITADHAEIPLAVGGTLSATAVDLDDPLARGLGRVDAGRAPSAPDEVAVPHDVADELGLLDDGDLSEGARLPTTDGSLRVVGLLAPDSDDYLPTAVLAPETRLPTKGRPRFLADLPDSEPSPTLMALQRELADAGVVAWFRDASEHPDAWGVVPRRGGTVDPVAVVVGAIAIGAGLVEVVVLVGAVFAVAARSQSRTLGVMLASGATPADLRRVVLAQGAWVGALGSVTGLGLGVGVLLLGRDLVGRLAGRTVWEYSWSPGSLAVLALVGALTGVLAALLPARGVGRMTAVEALDGRIATGGRRRIGERLRAPATWLAGTGLIGLAASGYWIAHEYAGSPSYPSVVPVVAAALCTIALLVGALLGLPFVVDAVASRASRGWLPWRLASRDAARHRGRTSAAAAAIGVMATGAVLAGFGVQADAAERAQSRRSMPDDTAELYLPRHEIDGTDPAATGRILDAVDHVLGGGTVVPWGYAAAGRHGVSAAGIRAGAVIVVGDDFLAAAGVDDAARRAFDDGEAIIARSADRADTDAVRLVAGPRRHRNLDETVPAVATRLDWFPSTGVWISTATAHDLGVRSDHSSTWLVADRAITSEDLARLRLYGIDGWTDAADVGQTTRLVWAGTGLLVVLTGLVIGLVVALAGVERRGETAVLDAVGSPPSTTRASSAAHAVLVGGLGVALGLVLGGASGASLLQVIGTPGTPVPWAGLGAVVVLVPVLCAVIGWLAAPRRSGALRRA